MKRMHPGMMQPAEVIAEMQHDPVNGYPVLDIYTAAVEGGRRGDGFAPPFNALPIYDGHHEAPLFYYTNYIEGPLPVTYHGNITNATTVLTDEEVRTLAIRQELRMLHRRLG